jgi:uncharacterized coiled-coil DUF342 family protein
VKESHNERANELMQEIYALRKQRGKLIGAVRHAKRTIPYKETEAQAIETMLGPNGARDANGRVIYLKKMKKTLEFKIATEASSLSAERELIKRINEVNAQLEEALAPLRLKRRLEMVKADAERQKTVLADSMKECVEIDTKLDRLYADLKKVLGISRERKVVRKGAKPSAAMSTISLEDIAVIKKIEK